MAWFDRPTSTYPRRWSEYSLDFKLFMIWEFSLMGLMVLGIAGLAVSDTVFYGGLGAYALAILLAAQVNRSIKGWRWPGLKPKDVVLAVLGTIAMAIFLYVTFRRFALERFTIAMFSFAVSIAVWNVLVALNLAQMSAVEFEACRGEGQALSDPAADPDPLDPVWKRMVRGFYVIAFFAVWLDAMGFFYAHSRIMEGSSPVATAVQTSMIEEHGGIVYVTAEQKGWDDLLKSIMMIGIPSVLAAGFAIHFVVGVKLFSNVPESKGLFGR